MQRNPTRISKKKSFHFGIKLRRQFVVLCKWTIKPRQFADIYCVVFFVLSLKDFSENKIKDKEIIVSFFFAFQLM